MHAQHSGYHYPLEQQVLLPDAPQIPPHSSSPSTQFRQYDVPMQPRQYGIAYDGSPILPYSPQQLQQQLLSRPANLEDRHLVQLEQMRQHHHKPYHGDVRFTQPTQSRPQQQQQQQPQNIPRPGEQTEIQPKLPSPPSATAEQDHVFEQQLRGWLANEMEHNASAADEVFSGTAGMSGGASGNWELDPELDGERWTVEDEVEDG